MPPDRLDEQLRPWVARAERHVAARLADARSHALTGNLPVATQRLIDLHRGLIGPDGSGVVGDSRAAFYRHAHADFDESIHDPARRHPTAEGMAAARTAPIGGGDAHRELSAHIERARIGLVAASATTGRQSDHAARAAAIDAWHARASATLRAWAWRTISDGQISINAAVSWLRRRPEYRDGE